MNWMSSALSARNTEAFQPNCDDKRPRRPNSQVRVTTWRRGGSPAIALGRRQGWSGLAQASSMVLGARVPSL
jgi:hypothetical protein